MIKVWYSWRIVISSPIILSPFLHSSCRRCSCSRTYDFFFLRQCWSSAKMKCPIEISSLRSDKALIILYLWSCLFLKEGWAIFPHGRNLIIYSVERDFALLKMKRLGRKGNVCSKEIGTRHIYFGGRLV